MDLIQNLRGKRTVVMVSHRPSHIRMSDAVVVLNRGVVEFYGSPDQALNMASMLGSKKAGGN